jgi:hypothetical protein
MGLMVANVTNAISQHRRTHQNQASFVIHTMLKVIVKAGD